MASSSDPSASTFEQRLERHERVPRMDLPEAAGPARSTAASYARFIPREELGRAVAWVPDSLDARLRLEADRAAGSEAPAAPAPVDPEVQRAARQAQLQARLAEVFEQGRQLGREETTETMRAEAREALASLRQQQASEVGTPVAALLVQFQHGIDALEQSLARRLAGIAMQMARQVVRSELQTNAALVVDVTQEALADVLLSARHITVKVHPEDLQWIEQGCADAFEARDARLIADAHIERGGCLVESDLGVVDARLATRWASAVAAMGSPVLAEVDSNDGTATP
ncbi:FliH/SctL family protein [Sphaerotilus sp.]|uniref:FliH/SctL family protein n=1 Tax=Sphaerotilus sp. TaxID=2093942 RepID=UPI0034E21CC6